MVTIDLSSKRRSYWSVLSSTGKFHKEVPKGTEGAIVRTYEVDGKKGEKTELTAENITGKIKNVSLYEGDYGKNVLVLLDDDDTVLSFPSSYFGEALMQRLPKVNLDEEVKFAPYSFTADDGKKKKGMNLFQGEEKLTNHYAEQDKKGDWKNINGLPEPDEDDKKDWALFYKNTFNKFYVKELKKHPLFVEKLNDQEEESDEISADEIMDSM